MQSIIHSSLTNRALEKADVPMGQAITVNEGGDNDGTFSFNAGAPDFNEVMSKLVGVVLEMHALKSMVIPSNASSLDPVLDYLKNERMAEADIERMDQLDDLIESMESIIGNLKGLSSDR